MTDTHVTATSILEVIESIAGNVPEKYINEEIKRIQAEVADSCDFVWTLGGYEWRCIQASEIDEIMVEELSADNYLLGCFNADFLASVIDWPFEAIQAVQEAEKYESIGEYINANPQHLTTLQHEYVKWDGYGHHFATYDGEEHKAADYYVFRVN